MASTPNDYNANDKQNYSRYYPKRLPAEVLLDAIDQVTESKTGFGGVPHVTRAVQLPDNGFNSYFLTVFGRPESTSACECERSSEANLAQSLHLLNSSEVQGKLSAAGGRAAQLAADTRPRAKTRSATFTCGSIRGCLSRTKRPWPWSTCPRPRTKSSPSRTFFGP